MTEQVISDELTIARINNCVGSDSGPAHHLYVQALIESGISPEIAVQLYEEIQYVQGQPHPTIK